MHYKNEIVFPFERFVTKLKENFFVLGKDEEDERLTGKQKVDHILKSIKSTNPNVIAACKDKYL